MNQDLISARYDISQRVGQGGQGSVYLARSKQTGQEVALKIFNITPSNRDMVFQEAKALSAVSYPNCNPYIACYHNSFYDPTTNQAVIEMEYVRGPTVSAYTQPLRNQGNRPLLILCSKLLLKAALHGLQYIHSHNILHNDIKPSNIVVGPNKVPVIVDFGISCFVHDAINSACTQQYNKVIGNCCNTMAGTSIYIPPEATKNVRYPSSDLWSLAATVYEIMSGSNIWGLNVGQYNAYSLMKEVVNKINQQVPPNKLSSGDQTLDMVVNSFLNYDPASRMSIDQALSVLG